MPRKAALWAPIAVGAMLAVLSLAACMRPLVPVRILAGFYTAERTLEARVSTLLILANGNAEPALLIGTDAIASEPGRGPTATSERET